MLLLKPTMEFEKELQNFRKEFLIYGGSMDGCGSLKKIENIKEWIEQVELLSKKENCPDNLVQCSQYIYVRENDNKIVGVIQIRHYFNQFLEKYSGHIGYSVCNSERNKGYATNMLKEVLPICKNIGINKVLISCIDSNIASKKVILKNGGVYENTVYEPSRNVNLERYWISL